MELLYICLISVVEVKKGRSGGKTTDMSIMTESSDLLIRAESFSLEKAKAELYQLLLEKGIQKKQLVYPAFAIPDDNVKPYKSKDEVPEEKDIWNGWMTIGKIYVTDIWDYDFYGEMKHFTKPVCIIHGSNDGLVKLSYSERAAKCYPNAELHVIEGADHGFKGKYVKECNKYIINFLKKLKFIQ